MKRDSPLYAYSSRIAVGMAVSGGIICAACISGLPAAPCKALAHLYGNALNFFGITGFCGIVILGALAVPDRETDHQHRLDTIMISIFLGIGLLTIILGFLQSVSLGGIIDQCWH
jgi:hypothetical protein